MLRPGFAFDRSSSKENFGSGSVRVVQKRRYNVVERRRYARSANIFACLAIYFFYLTVSQGAQSRNSVGESALVGLIKVRRDLGSFTANFEKSLWEDINVGLSNNPCRFGPDASHESHKLDFAPQFRGLLRVASRCALAPKGKQVSNGGGDNGDKRPTPKTNSWWCFAWHSCLFVLGAGFGCSPIPLSCL